MSMVIQDNRPAPPHERLLSDCLCGDVVALSGCPADYLYLVLWTGRDGTPVQGSEGWPHGLVNLRTGRCVRYSEQDAKMLRVVRVRARLIVEENQD